MQPSSPIMEPMDSLTFNKNDVFHTYADENDFNSVPFISNGPAYVDNSNELSFLLMDAEENLYIPKLEIFCKRLKCMEDDKVKVVSIFGNTGDGKSHTINHIFFDGTEVFKTSPEQNSCTIGVHAAMQKQMGVICLDTEGFLGLTSQNNRRMRMLMKILAISDIVIYRARSERLHSDMYEFLGTASKAFSSHFARALQSLDIPGNAKAKGPAVIIFHETRHTKPLESTVEKSAEEKLRESFSSLNLETNAFSSLLYVGIKSENSKTDYSKIKRAIKIELENTTVRSPRQPGIVFKAMHILNRKFSGATVEDSVNPFLEQFFTCPMKCESCGGRCQHSMGHINDGESHMNKNPCKYQHQYENKEYICKRCYDNGRKIKVTISAQTQNENSWYNLAQYAWKGSLIECTHCGEIYRARKYWYGNKSPEEESVRSEIIHVWKDGDFTTRGAAHSAQMVLDRASHIGGAISNYLAQPIKVVTDSIADTVAPSYWKPNHTITHCNACKKDFEKTGLHKHHCRGCGEGFCHSCSSNNMPVPGRGWDSPVRVCNDCRQSLLKKDDNLVSENATDNFSHTNSNHNTTTGPTPIIEADVRMRKYGETFFNTISSVATVALEYPKEIIKDSVRPSYWVSDAEAPNCNKCKLHFGTAEELEIAKTNGNLTTAPSNISKTSTKSITGNCRRHHCRRCGQAVCGECSKSRLRVPERGWEYEVRVCDLCALDDSTKPKSE